MEFCHALFRFTNRDLQLVNPCNRRIRFRRQILNVHQIILRQIIERLRHLFEVKDLRPTLIPSFQTDSFSPFNLPSSSLEHGQQFFKIFRLACQCSINRFPQSIPLRGFRFITQPFIIALAMSLRLLDNRQTVLDAQCITEPPDGF